MLIIEHTQLRIEIKVFRKAIIVSDGDCPTLIGMEIYCAIALNRQQFQLWIINIEHIGGTQATDNSKSYVFDQKQKAIL